MSNNNLFIYGDLLSQPTRAVLIFCKMNKIQHSFKEIRIIKGETRTEEFKKVNPLMKVPAIEELDQEGRSQYMFESISIMKYLNRKHQCKEEWYPQQDYDKCKMVDMCLDFYSSTLRPNCVYLVYYGVFASKLGQKIPSDFQIDRAIKKVIYTLKDFQSIFIPKFTKKQPFINSNQSISIADLMNFCDIIQILFVQQIDFYKDKQFDSLNKWILNMYQNQEIQEVHSQYLKILSKLNNQAFIWLQQQNKSISKL